MGNANEMWHAYCRSLLCDILKTWHERRIYSFKTKLFPSLNLISIWNFVIFQSSLSVPWKKIPLVKQNFIFFLAAWALKVSIYFITDHRIWFNCPCTNLTPFLSTDKISYWRSLVTFTQCLKVPDPFLRPCSKQHSFFH